MSSQHYLSYGLHIQSEIECPEFPPHPDPSQAPDVSIHSLAPVESVSQFLEKGYFESRPGIFRLTVPSIAHYIVEDGRRITVVPAAGAAPEQVRIFLLGSTMGALLYQRGLVPIHGSSVETRWGAMIFVGPSGMGKSTLAAEFHRRGYRLLSDDVCAVQSSGDGLRVLPALSNVRLCADAYDRFGAQAEARFDIDKFIVPLGHGYCSQPTPLRAIHVLSNKSSGEPEFELLRGFDRIQCIFDNLYRPHFLPGQQTQNDLMRLAGRIAQSACVSELRRPRNPALIPGLIDFLESKWAEHFGQSLQQENKGNAA